MAGSVLLESEGGPVIFVGNLLSSLEEIWVDPLTWTEPPHPHPSTPAESSETYLVA